MSGRKAKKVLVKDQKSFIPPPPRNPPVTQRYSLGSSLPKQLVIIEEMSHICNTTNTSTTHVTLVQRKQSLTAHTVVYMQIQIGLRKPSIFNLVIGVIEFFSTTLVISYH